MTISRHWITNSVLAFSILAMGSSCLAQDKTPQKIEHDVLFETPGASPHGVFLSGMPEEGQFNLQGPGKSFQFISAEMENEGKPIKGAPYSAEAITETTQILSDGNRISHKSTTSIFRDSEGRTRRDQTLAAVGPWVSDNEPLQTTFIRDPVAGVSYVLNPKDHTARKIPLMHLDIKTTESSSGTVVEMKSSSAGEGGQTGSGEPHLATKRHVISEDVIVKSFETENVKQESLGKQTMEGLTAEGTRSTFTIAAGKIGNDQPINIITEKWTSPELQTLVYSKHNDPRMGETIYRLTNINRTEPSHSLFELPPDYKIEDGVQQIFIRKEIRK
jgi:hypothetical protein